MELSWVSLFQFDGDFSRSVVIYHDWSWYHHRSWYISNNHKKSPIIIKSHQKSPTVMKSHHVKWNIFDDLWIYGHHSPSNIDFHNFDGFQARSPKIMKKDHQRAWSLKNVSCNMGILGDYSWAIMIPKFQLTEVRVEATKVKQVMYRWINQFTKDRNRVRIDDSITVWYLVLIILKLIPNTNIQPYNFAMSTQ